MSSRPRVALLGLGAWGRNHLRILREFGELHSAFDVDPSQCAVLQPGEQAASWNAILCDGRVNAVVIATPAPTHHALALAALQAGKDVLVEKPMTLKASEAEELVGVADRHGRVLMVGHVTLYHPAVLRLRELIRSGDLGAVRYVYAHRLNLGTVRPSEDILWSFAPHDFAAMGYLLAETPTSVRAIGSAFLRDDRSDVTVTHLEFASGIKGHVFVSWLHPFREQRLTVIGDRKMATFVDNGTGGSLRLYDSGVDVAGEVLVHRRDEGLDITLPPQEPLRLEIAHFLECCDRREEPLSGGRHGLGVVAVLEAASRSLRSGGEPIRCSAALGISR